MLHHLYFLFKIILFIFLQVCFFKFIQLKSEEIFVLSVFLYLIFQQIVFSKCLMIVVKQFPVFLQLLAVIGNDVYYTQLEILLVEQQILMLTVYVNKLFSKFPYYRQLNGRVVNKCSAFSCCSKFSSEYTVFPVVVYIIVSEKSFHVISRQVKVCFNSTFLFACLYLFRVCTLSKQQTDCSENYTFSSSCFSCYDRKTRREVYLQLLY